MRGAYVIAAAVMAAAAFVAYRRGEGEALEWPELEIPDVAQEAAQEAAQVIDQFTGGSMKLSAMSRVTAADVNNQNVRAFLRVIRRGEGTMDEAGYRRMFGGELFSSFADHPRKVIRKNGYASSAAGAYQALTSTWDETRSIMGLRDFSPTSQDWFAVGRIAARGALADVIAGRFAVALSKCAREWASLPGSPYGQPVISMATAASVYASAGGETV
jgi:muramidase (phage lysozyme)